MLALAALDTDDLAVISAHVQDAVLRLGDIRYNRRLGKFSLLANRFAWEESGSPQRRLTALQFDRVTEVKSQNILQGEKSAVVSLLTITFEAGELPSGTILLTFSGGGTIRLAVECIEVQMKDLGPAWSTASGRLRGYVSQA
jgi:hypothetical protein